MKMLHGLDHDHAPDCGIDAEIGETVEAQALLPLGVTDDDDTIEAERCHVPY